MLDFEPFDELPAEHQIGLMLLVPECCHVLHDRVTKDLPGDYYRVFEAIAILLEAEVRVTWAAIAALLRREVIGLPELGITAWDTIGVDKLHQMACNVPDSINGYLRSLCEHVHRETVGAGF